MEYIRLNNGMEMPQLGIGGFSQSEDAIETALSLGYRLIDTAAQYENEEQVGAAIRNSSVGRDEIFLTTKLWTEDIRQNRTREAFFESLQRLKTDYVDLYLLHWPAEGFERAWLEMEKLQKEGYIRAIGVSNFHPKHFVKLEETASVSPVVNQVESHPRFNNRNLIIFCEKKDIRTEAWCPFGGTGARMLQNTTLLELAEKYQRTSAQIILRWDIQRGVIVIPRSAHRERMQENMQIFDFILSEEDMEKIDGLDAGRRLGADPENFLF